MGGLPPILDNQIPSLVHDWASVSRVPFSCRWNPHASLHAFNSRTAELPVFWGLFYCDNKPLCVPSAECQIRLRLGVFEGAGEAPSRARLRALLWCGKSSSGLPSGDVPCGWAFCDPPTGGCRTPNPEPRTLEKTAGRSIGEILGFRTRTRTLPNPSED